jgi:acetolactate synthase small subunit
LELTLSAPSALTRIVIICARRRLDVLALAFWTEKGGRARAEVVLEGEPRQLARADAWLDRLVDVLEVSEQVPARYEAAAR